MFLTYSFLLTAKLSNKTKKPALTIIDYIKARIHGVILSNHSLTYHLGSNLVPRFSQSYPQGWVGENPGTRLLQKFLMCSSYNLQVRLHIVQLNWRFSCFGVSCALYVLKYYLKNLNCLFRNTQVKTIYLISADVELLSEFSIEQKDQSESTRSAMSYQLKI